MVPPSNDRRLIDFLGYGQAAPTLVFFGYDEYCHKSTVELNLRARQSFPEFHDKNSACEELAKACEEAGLSQQAAAYRQALIPGAEPTWTFAAMFSARFLSRGLTWQQEYALLGSRDIAGRTLLTERFPLPRPSHRHKYENRDLRAIIQERRSVLRQRVVATLPDAVLFVSYAGRPTDVLGRMQRSNGRSWETIPGSQHENQRAEISQTVRHVVLRVPFPRDGDEAWWGEWLGLAVEMAKNRREAILRAI